MEKSVWEGGHQCITHKQLEEQLKIQFIPSESQDNWFFDFSLVRIFLCFWFCKLTTKVLQFLQDTRMKVFGGNETQLLILRKEKNILSLEIIEGYT